ncbi:hypothetical protein T484DRAFT_1841283 [Baffinella frigidus]|nr:hypothetical protein T484DRAFT_1841283 [Cryptophyta sp. CCMP2293]
MDDTPSALSRTLPQIVARASTVRSFFTTRRHPASSELLTAKDSKSTDFHSRAFSRSLGNLFTNFSDPQPLQTNPVLITASTTIVRIPVEWRRPVPAWTATPKSTGRRHSLHGWAAPREQRPTPDGSTVHPDPATSPIAALKRALSFGGNPKAAPVRDREAIKELSRTLSRRRSDVAADQAAIELAVAPVP